MSAILKRRAGGSNSVFVEFNGKTGSFVHSVGKGEEKVTSNYDQLDYAFVRKLGFKEDEFEGNPVYKGQIHLESKEDGSKVIATFKLGTFVGARILGLLNAAADKPETAIRFNTGSTKAGEKLVGGDVADKDFVWFSARLEGAAETLKPKFDTPDGLLPKAIEVSLGGGKKGLNMDPVNEVAEALFAKVVEKLTKHAEGEKEGNAVPAESDGDHADAADLREPETADTPRA